MKIRDADILTIPGIAGGSDRIWHRRWQARMRTARPVEPGETDRPDRTAWVRRIVAAAAGATRPVVLIGHALGAIAIVHAAPMTAKLNVRAAFLVAPPDPETGRCPPANTFLPVPADPLPFPSMLVASRNDPWCAFDQADAFAAAWDSALVDAGNSGRLDVESGHGPWPEGMMMFARLMSRI